MSEGEESNYKMNFRKKGSGASPYFLTEREDRYTRNDTSLVYLGSFDHFLVNFHQRPYPMVKVAGIINDDMLRINSSKTIISGGTGDSRFTYYHYFKRVSY